MGAANSRDQATRAKSRDNLHILVVATFGFIGLLTPFLLPVFFFENRIIGSLFEGWQVIPLSFASAAVALVGSNKVVESFRERRRQNAEDA